MTIPSDFAYAPMQWRTVEAFRAHLRKHNPNVVPWAQGIALHHTASPVPSTWKGLESIASLARFYRFHHGWKAGPHLFICAGSPNPANDGIFQLTPLNMTGVHAQHCNSTTWGIEVVGNYTSQPWSDATTSLVIGAVHELMSWKGITPNRKTLIYHRECVPSTQCPGQAIVDRFDWILDGVQWRSRRA